MNTFKDIFLYGLMLFLPQFLSAQSLTASTIDASTDLFDEVDIEASFAKMPISKAISVYPRVIKKAQVFVVHFNYEIKGTYTIALVDAKGAEIEIIYNSQLSVFDAVSTINLEVFTPLESGMYYVVLESKDFSQATKLIKF